MATALAMNSNDDDSGKTKLAIAMVMDSTDDDDSADDSSNLLSSDDTDYMREMHDFLGTAYFPPKKACTDLLKVETTEASQWQTLCFLLKCETRSSNDDLKLSQISEDLLAIYLKEIVEHIRSYHNLLRSFDFKWDRVQLKLRRLLKRKPLDLEWSRYHRDFHEDRLVAAGGFGKVFRAWNKLDGAVYAIKKITIRSTTISLEHLAEVKTLASLNHINIVPYKAAWLEPLLSPGKSSNSTNDSSAMVDGEEEEEEEEDDDEQNGVASLYYSRTKLEISDSLKHPEHDSEEFVLFEGSSGGPPVSGGDENRNQVIELEDAPRSVISIKDAQAHPQPTTLYIQMKLCDFTLREWLDERNRYEDFDEVQSHLDVELDVFQQLLNGLNYIHSRDIVHHDIKPNNIFVDQSNFGAPITIQLGDFGLACPLQSSHAGVGFGTALYAAPEQLEGKGKSDPKSDIYSLGIILLELLVPFSTDMERVEIIKQVRRGQYPPDLDRYFTTLLKYLLQQRPSRRPEIVDLLEAVNRIQIIRDEVIAELRKSFSLRDDEIVSLRTQIDVHLESEERKEQQLRAKDEELQAKDEELQAKDEEIFKLKEMLWTFQEKEEGNGQSGDADGQETNGAAR